MSSLDAMPPYVDTHRLAAFPGPLGRVYRALVIGTRGHVVAVMHMLRSVRQMTLEPA